MTTTRKGKARARRAPITITRRELDSVAAQLGKIAEHAARTQGASMRALSVLLGVRNRAEGEP